MEISGTIVQLLPEMGGTNKSGNPWRKREYVLETADQYPKKILFQVWGEKIDQYNLQQGDQATVSIDLESREYNGKWYTVVKAWKVQKGGSGSMPPTYTEGELPPPPPPSSDLDDLPF